MKRIHEVFTLTVSEQRVIVALVTALVVFAAITTYRDAARDAPRAVETAYDQPSPSPGMGP
jgi:hypothetical protein